MWSLRSLRTQPWWTVAAPSATSPCSVSPRGTRTQPGARPRLGKPPDLVRRHRPREELTPPRGGAAPLVDDDGVTLLGQPQRRCPPGPRDVRPPGDKDSRRRETRLPRPRGSRRPPGWEVPPRGREGQPGLPEGPPRAWHRERCLTKCTGAPRTFAPQSSPGPRHRDCDTPQTPPSTELRSRPSPPLSQRTDRHVPEARGRPPARRGGRGRRAEHTLTAGRGEVHGDLGRAQGALPDGELVEGSVLVALAVVLLRRDHQVDVGLPVGVGHLPAGVRGAQGAVDVDFQALLGFPGEQDVSPVGTWGRQRRPC